MLSKFLDPKNDIAFKKVFGTEKNKDILIHFLNDMITFKENSPIQDVTFLKNVQDPEIAAQKTSIVDILCVDQKGNHYIVEMQVAKQKGFEKRAQYYASKVYCSQNQSGGAYHDLKEVIFLAISNFTLFPHKKAYKSDHVTLDKESHENDLKDFSFTFLELPKFNKSIDQLTNVIEKWAYFFKHADETSEEELEKLIGEDPIIQKAYKELSRFGWNKEELFTYEQAEKYEWDYKASLAQKLEEGEKVGIEKGKKVGIEEGEKVGIEKGKKVGIEEGKKVGIEEGKKVGIEEGKKEIAKKMLDQRFDIQTIQTITGLDQSEIELLKVYR